MSDALTSQSPKYFGKSLRKSGSKKQIKRKLEKFGLATLRGLDPELAHNLGLRALKIGARFTSGMPPSKLLETEVLGLKFTSPIGTAAGFDKNGVSVSALAKLGGIGFMEVGTVTPRPQYGNDKPRIFRLPKDQAIINRMGFNNVGVKQVKVNLEKSKSLRGSKIVGINAGANKDSVDRVEDYCTIIQELYAYADYFTINVSSPNTTGLRTLQHGDRLNELLERCLEAREHCRRQYLKTVPIALKVSPDLTDSDISKIAESILEYRLDGLITTNTTIQRPINLRSGEVDQLGGLSGKPLFKRSTEVLSKFYSHLGRRVPIIGVGGISTPEDVYQKICAGASLVQLYTAMVYQGPSVIRHLTEGLTELLNRDGRTSIAEAVGTGSQHGH